MRQIYLYDAGIGRLLIGIIVRNRKDVTIVGDMIKQVDWRQVAFVGMSLLLEQFPLHLPQIQYWNGERELRRKLRKRGRKPKDQDDDNKRL